MGLKEESLLIFKLAANIIDPKTNQRVNIDDKLSNFLDGYIVNGSLRVPEKFSEWILSGGAGLKNASTFFNPDINPIWKDFGFQYIKTLPRLGESIDFYIKLAKLIPGYNYDMYTYDDKISENRTDPKNKPYINLIYNNLYNYNLNREDLMRNSRERTALEESAYATEAVVKSPYTAYQSLQNPAIRSDSKNLIDTYSSIDKDGTLPQIVVALLLSAPLSFANALIDFQTGEYKSGIINFADAAISTLIQYFGGKAILNNISVKRRTVLVRVATEVLTQKASNKAKEKISNSDMPELDKKAALTLVTEDKLKPIIEDRVKKGLLEI